jgi:hypothetical protein
MSSRNFIFIATGLLMGGLLVYLFNSNGTRYYTWNEHYKEQNKARTNGRRMYFMEVEFRFKE